MYALGGERSDEARTQGEVLLRTPTAQLAVNGGSQHPNKRKAGGHGPTLADEVEHLLPTPTSRNGKGANQRGDATCLHGALLPTPRATDGTNGGPNQRGSSGDLMLPSAVHHLLPTPAVNDMGEGKTVEKWDEWTAVQKAKHGNGNGHGPSLAIEALRLLPTPTAMDGKASGGSSPSDVTLTDAVVRTSLGAHTNPRFAAGNESSDE
jgi:hypothetical protein